MFLFQISTKTAPSSTPSGASPAPRPQNPTTSSSSTSSKQNAAPKKGPKDPKNEKSLETTVEKLTMSRNKEINCKSSPSPTQKEAKSETAEKEPEKREEKKETEKREEEPSEVGRDENGSAVKKENEIPPVPTSCAVDEPEKPKESAVEEEKSKNSVDVSGENDAKIDPVEDCKADDESKETCADVAETGPIPEGDNLNVNSVKSSGEEVAEGGK